MSNQPLGPQNPSQWVRGAVWAMGLGLGVVIALGSALYSDLRSDSVERYERITKELGEIKRRKQLIGAQADKLARQLARLETHVSDHAETSKEWKLRIERTEAKVHDLTTNAYSRPDGFTGTEGDKLERRIDLLELQSVLVARMEKELAALRDEVQTGLAYYRAQILPLIQQSNVLQQQRIQQSMK